MYKRNTTTNLVIKLATTLDLSPENLGDMFRDYDPTQPYHDPSNPFGSVGGYAARQLAEGTSGNSFWDPMRTGIKSYAGGAAADDLIANRNNPEFFADNHEH